MTKDDRLTTATHLHAAARHIGCVFGILQRISIDEQLGEITTPEKERDLYT